jgi:hypothetical protein
MIANAALLRSSRAPSPPARISLRAPAVRARLFRALRYQSASAPALWVAHHQRALGDLLPRVRERALAALAFSAAAASQSGLRFRRVLHTLADAAGGTGMLLLSWKVPRYASIGLKVAGSALAVGMLALAIWNNWRHETEGIRAREASAIEFNDNVTVVVRQERLPNSYVDNEGDIAVDESEEDAAYPRAVQTVRFVNPESGLAGRARVAMAKIGGFVAFPGNQNIKPTEMPDKIHSARGGAIMDEVDMYLWEVYQRSPTKKDHSGDFTWKDPAAAKHMGIPLADYVIGGMDPEFREQLYHAGRAMDADGVQWSILSAFRDDYRQGLASGYKARVGRSLHGGTKRTGGYGFGRAVDITNADGDAEAVWHWIDKHGAKYGLHRPMPGNDPAHVQSRGEWRNIALSLRENRRRVAEAVPEKARPASKAKVATSK